MMQTEKSGETGDRKDATPIRPSRTGPWVLATALALLAGWLAARNLALRGEVRMLRTERELAEVSSKLAGNQLKERSFLAEKMINDLGARLRRSEDLGRLTVSSFAPPADNPGPATGTAIWDPARQAGWLAIEKLPPVGGAQNYQLWISDPQAADAVSAGLVRVGADGRATLAFKPVRPVSKAGAFVITLEPNGGAPKPGGPVVLSGR